MSAVKDAIFDGQAESLFYRPKADQSTRSMQLVAAEVQKRFPDWFPKCEPYKNVLTFQEWKRRGYKVKKGEKSIRIPIMSEIEEEDKKTKRLVRRTACLFARPQVEQI